MKKLSLIASSLFIAVLLSGCLCTGGCGDNVGSYADSCCGTNSYVGAWY